MPDEASSAGGREKYSSANKSVGEYSRSVVND
jgi:hypothetical protein